MDWIQANWLIVASIAAAVFFALQWFRALATGPGPKPAAELPPAKPVATELTPQEIRAMAFRTLNTAEAAGKVCEFVRIVNEAKPLFNCCEDAADEPPAAE